MQIILSMEGYDVDVAVHGEDGLALLDNGLSPDLILVDHNMNVMNGPKFLIELEKTPHFAKCPVVLMTALDIEYVETNKATEIFTQKGSLSEIRKMVARYCK